MSAPEARRGQIHDLGYSRYAGERLPHGRRFLVVARNVVAMAWRQKKGVRFPVYLTALITFGALVAMYVLGNKVSAGLKARGAPIPGEESVIYYATMWFYRLGAFLLAATVGSAAVADDLRLGAFQFYFARPLRTRDYVLGKLAGVAALVGVAMFAAPLTLALFRLLLAGDLETLGQAWPIVPRTAAFGLVATAAFALPAVGLGALVGRRGVAQAIFAVYYLILGGLARSLSRGLEMPELALFDLGAQVEILGRAFLGLDREAFMPPAWQAGLALVALVGLAVLVTARRVARAETAGLGGTS